MAGRARSADTPAARAGHGPPGRPAPVDVHADGVDQVRRALRRHGYRPARIDDRDLPGIDVVVPIGSRLIRLAIRVAAPYPRDKTVRIRGRHYRYRVACYHWNLHVHGRPLPPPDFWLLVPADLPSQTLCVPGAVLAGRLSYSLLARARRGRAALRAFVGRWDLIGAAVEAVA